MSQSPIMLVSVAFGDGLGAPTVSEHVALGLSRGAAGREVVACTPDRAPALLRGAHALVLAGPDLCAAGPGREPLTGIATEARQAGVPAYGVTGCAEPDLFRARILDLQRVEHGHDARSLRAAGQRLGKAIWLGSRADA
ncbi:MAG: hypothetical protein ACYDA6_05835 [Solirubrobacteraceae bacterium]